ncbi:MAG: HNH endonuclease, partial [Myxococcaceae bacterium]
GHARAVRLYAWRVTDNGRATGTARPADERRIQAIGSRTQQLDATADPETVVLGWSDEFGPDPLIVAFNPYGVARRVNGKIERKVAAGVEVARASDSQQFRQSLLDEATSVGIALGRNQHGEYVVAMKPARFEDYLNQYKPTYQADTAATGAPLAGARSMDELVADAELEEAEPLDASDADVLPTFDPSAIEDGRERVAREIAIRRGQAAFRQQLLATYGCCAMTGCTVEAALEAAHIVRYQGPGTNHPTNGLLLRADVHTLFDFGLLAVDAAALSILVAASLSGTEYAGLGGQPLRITHASVSPSREALQVHRALAGL